MRSPGQRYAHGLCILGGGKTQRCPSNLECPSNLGRRALLSVAQHLYQQLRLPHHYPLLPLPARLPLPRPPPLIQRTLFHRIPHEYGPDSTMKNEHSIILKRGLKEIKVKETRGKYSVPKKRLGFAEKIRRGACYKTPFHDNMPGGACYGDIGMLTRALVYKPPTANKSPPSFFCTTRLRGVAAPLFRSKF